MRARLTKVKSIDLKKAAVEKAVAEEAKTNRQSDRIVILVLILLGVIFIVLGLIFGFQRRLYVSQ
ncbi:hypothetical protein SAMN05192573_1192 [Mucilaginibacter gossypii]|uniref:Uncharacterized protein n=1 Tax=Mucilaginibacter gossypii TaxID=551996 RepID=A0A1G8JR93_9SPHI|nr:hypothetical protein SAMN05192573_1192 [Mucilaginibacter gossypii]